ncbi:hypothetical protein pb186bvf_015974 [Paramecium bursaria]
MKQLLLIIKSSNQFIHQISSICYGCLLDLIRSSLMNKQLLKDPTVIIEVTSCL